MDPQPASWDRIQTLFEEALQLGEEDRSMFLERNCEGDDLLRGEVESLLASYVPGEAELEESPVRLPISDSDSRNDVPADVIPGYRILKELHRGGQGVVYQAVQQSTKRKVALKLMLEGPFAGPASKRRFEREVELVGSLRHPGIVPIFDSGMTHGQYFYAMEYIRGKSLDEYVRDDELTVNQTLSLFIKVCSAVDYAHQRGVIHRDLKPSNVLVDESGEPHVLDFGLAKVGGAEFDDAGQALLVSVTGQVIGTLAYMSPEQAAGRTDQVDMRSDVYALGVLLYELLSGQLPYSLDGSMAENLSTIQKAEPRRLTVCGRRINDEVGTIVLKALSKEKARRYPTAGALGEDLDRFLHGRPIEAKRDSVLYLLQKALRRHMVPAAVATTVVGLILLSSVVSWTLYIDAQRARKREATAAAELKAERDKAQRRGDEVNRSLYFAEMRLAGEALLEPGGISQVRELVNRWHPAQARVDLRGWEWFYLDALGRREQTTLKTGTTAPNWCLDWSPDAKRIVVCGNDRRIRIWDTTTATQIHELESDAFRLVDWSPDGTRIAAAGEQGEVVILDSATLRQVAALDGNSGLVKSLQWSPDGSRLLTVGFSDCIVWDVSNQTQILHMPNDERSIACACWNSDGTLLATVGDDSLVGIWNVDNAEPLRELNRVLTPIGTIAWSPDSTKLAAGSDNGRILVWEVDKPDQVGELVAKGKVRSISWSPDSTHLAATHADRTVRIWDTQNYGVAQTLHGHTAEIFCVRWSPDGSRLASTGSDLSIRLWDVNATDRTQTVYDELSVHCIDWDADNDCLAAGLSDGSIRLWNTATGKIIRTLHGHEPGFIDGGLVARVFVRWSPDCKWLASAGRDGTVRLWDVRSGQELRCWKQPGRVFFLSWSPDGSRLISTGRTVRIWDIDADKEIYQFDQHSRPVWTVSWNPVDSRIASAEWNADDPHVKIWDSNTGNVVATLRGHEGLISCVEWNSDGSRIATASWDRTVRIWDASSGEEVADRMHHTEVVGAMAWNAHSDQPRLAAASTNSTVRIWNVEDAQLALTLHMPMYGNCSVRWSQDGTRLAAVSGQAVFVLDATIGYQHERSSQAGAKE